MQLTDLGKIVILLIILTICVAAPGIYNDIRKEAYNRGYQDGSNAIFYEAFEKGVEYEKNWTPCDWYYDSHTLDFREDGMTLCNKVDSDHIMSVDNKFNKEYEYIMPDWTGMSLNWTNTCNCASQVIAGSGGHGYYTPDFSI